MQKSPEQAGFTVTLAQRRGNRLLLDHIDALRQAFRSVKVNHPFRMDAVARGIYPADWGCGGKFDFCAGE